MKFSVKDFFSKCDQIPGKLRIWSHLLKKSLMWSFIFCAVFIEFLASYFDYDFVVSMFKFRRPFFKGYYHPYKFFPSYEANIQIVFNAAIIGRR